MNKIKDSIKHYGITALVPIVFVIVSVVAVIVVLRSIYHLQATAEERFTTTIDNAVSAIDKHYKGSITTLRAMQGFFAGSETVTRQEFYSFIGTSRFHDAYPGFSTFAYIPKIAEQDKPSFVQAVRSDDSVLREGYPGFVIKPEGQRSEYWPILYIEPEESSRVLLGADQLVDSVRSENIALSRDLGDISTSTMVELLPENKLGIILAAPLYKGGVVPDSLADRRTKFVGAFTSTFYVQDFLQNVIPEQQLLVKQVTMTLTDRTGQTLVYTDPEAVDPWFLRFLSKRLVAQRTMFLEASYLNLDFSAPMSSQLSRLEMLEPLIYLLILFATTLFVILVIIIVRRVQLISTLRARYQFVSILSHQLRTPVSRLRWGLDMIEVSQEQGQSLKDLVFSVAELNGIVEKMLLYLNIDDNLNGEKRIIVPIDNVVSEAVKKIPESHDRARVVVYSEKLGDVKVGLDSVSSVLSYIIDNALTYSNVAEQVKVLITKQADMALVKVSDLGFGIPENEQQEVFREFFRASNAISGNNVGSGISLFLAKSVIEAHGGKVVFSSMEGKGSVFTVTLPLV